ncbi:envelope stress response membrane protein PspB [Vibrio sp. RC27]
MSGAFFTAPLIVFMVFVAPLWLVLHYRSKRKATNGISDEELQTLNTLSQKADRLSSRVDTLEKILDSETPGWRNKYD